MCSKRNLTCCARNWSFLILVLAGCGGPQEDAELVFWAFGQEGERVQPLIERFEHEHPGIRVKVQAIPWLAAHEKLLTSYAGNTSPDVAQIGNTWIPEFTALEAIENLNGLVRQSGVLSDSSFFPGIWETNRMEGGIFGIPWYVDTRVLFYRKDILTRVGYPEGPKTWEQWSDASRKIKEQIGRDRYPIFFPTNEWNVPVILGMQIGADLLINENSNGGFTEAEFMSAFEFYISFFERDLSPVGIHQVSNVYQAFAEGYINMFITGPWNIGEFSRRIPQHQQHIWMTAPLPTPNESWPGLSQAGGSSLAIFRSSEKKSEAWKLIEFLSQPEIQLEFYRLTGDLPAATIAWEDSMLASNRYAKAFRTQLDHVHPFPKVPEWEQIVTKVQEHADIASRKILTVEETLEALNREVNVILEKRRWLLENRPEVPVTP